MTTTIEKQGLRKKLIDARFGTKEDLANLVDAAHALDMRVFLDIVLHHSGNNWSYPGDHEYYYYNGAAFPFGMALCPNLDLMFCPTWS